MAGTDVDSAGCAIQAEGETQAESSSRTEQLLMTVAALLVLLILVGGALVLLRRRPEGADEASAVSVPESKTAGSPAIDLVNQTAEMAHFCTLCQGKIKQADVMHKCTGCGKPFHISCSDRIPICPQCGTPM